LFFDNRDDYWSDGIFRDHFVTTVFPKQERFNQIFFALHARIDEEFSPEERRKDPFQDPPFTFRTMHFLTMLEKSIV
jgi:hypothetical protein